LLFTFLAFCLCTLLGNLLIFSVVLADSVCTLLATGSWIASSFHATIITTLTFTLPYCGSNMVDSFFCDIFPVAKLACADTSILETVVFTNIGVVSMSCFILILASYIRIISCILKMNTGEGRRKAASTCASHLVVVTMFFGPSALICTQPQLSKVLVTPVNIFSNLVMPMLNPAIYTLRNKEVKAALKKLSGGQRAAG
uniref:G-protein coupled receptors family 1 profile domain-containing protein n=1 Tax=Pelodiscus sinensis TaxID=13735 RepID=K7FSE7_PELSI